MKSNLINEKLKIVWKKLRDQIRVIQLTLTEKIVIRSDKHLDETNKQKRKQSEKIRKDQKKSEKKGNGNRDILFY